MNQRKLVVVMLLAVALLVAAVVYFATKPDTVFRETISTAEVAVGTKAASDAPAKKAAKTPERTRWVRVGPGTVVGVVREYGSDRPIEGVEVTLEAGLPGPNELLKAKTRADGGFTFEKVTNFDAWTFRAKAPAPLADSELGGVGVIENRETDLGTVYLAPTFGVPGIVVDEKDTPIAGASVRAIRSRSTSGSIDILRLIRELPTRAPAVDSAVTKEDGKFELRKVPPGRYDFTVEKTGWQIKVQSGEIVNPDAKDRPLKFVLVRGFPLDGAVVREGGGPVEGLPVVAFSEPNDPTSFNALDKVFATTDEKGAFHLDGLGGGRYIVAVSPEGEPITASPSVTVPSKKPVEIVLKGDCWLEGKITGDAEKTVADAQIYAISFDSRQPTVGNAKTDAEGHYVIRGLKSGPLQLFLVQAEGFGNYPEDLSAMMRGRGASDVKLVPGRNEKNVSLAKGGIVRGIVKEKGGDVPIAGARVELGTPLAFFGGSRGTTTGPDGKFELTSVAKGPAILMVSKDGWFQPGVNPQSVMMVMGARMQGGGGSQKDSGKGANIVISEPGEVIERTLELARGSSLAGTVTTPDGQPVSGAQVSLALEDDGGFGRMLGGLFPMPEPRLTDAQGHYEIPGPPPGQKGHVVARATGYLDGKSEPLSCAAGDAKTGVDVKLRQGATLAGKVRDDAVPPRPIEGALVRWTSMEGDANDWSVRWRLRSATPTVTDAKGEFRIPNVETGKLAIEVSDPRHLDWSSREVTVEDGKTSDFDVVLKLGAVIEGKVIGPDGKAKAGATVTCNHQGDTPDEFDDYSSDTNDIAADAQGSFRAEGLIPGRYEVQARAAGAAPSEPVMAETGGPAITLQLTQAFSITGVVRLKGGAGVGDVQVALMKRVEEKPDPQRTGSTANSRQIQNVRTGSGGEFELKDVPGGTYDLQVTVGWGMQPRPNVVPTTVKDVQAGRQSLVVEVDAGLTISGTAIGEDGKPIESGWVWGQADPPQSGASGVNGQIEEGSFEVTGLLPGKYRLTLSGNGGQQKVIVVEAGTKDLRVEFGGGGSIKIRVVKEDGTPAAGAWTWAQGPEGQGNQMTDGEGRCEIKGLGAGTYSVHASMNADKTNWSATEESVTVTVGGAADVELRLAKQQQ